MVVSRCSTASTRGCAHTGPGLPARALAARLLCCMHDFMTFTCSEFFSNSSFLLALPHADYYRGWESCWIHPRTAGSLSSCYSWLACSVDSSFVHANSPSAISSTRGWYDITEWSERNFKQPATRSFGNLSIVRRHRPRKSVEYRYYLRTVKTSEKRDGKNV